MGHPIGAPWDGQSHETFRGTSHWTSHGISWDVTDSIGSPMRCSTGQPTGGNSHRMSQGLSWDVPWDSPMTWPHGIPMGQLMGYPMGQLMGYPMGQWDIPWEISRATSLSGCCRWLHHDCYCCLLPCPLSPWGVFGIYRFIVSLSFIELSKMLFTMATFFGSIILGVSRTAHRNLSVRYQH